MSTFTALCVSLLSLFTVGYCYVKLSRVSGAIVSQSSTYKSALLAVDGNYAQYYPECAFTGKNEAYAWVQVDLRKAYSLKSVKLYLRNDGTSRQRVRCYTDNTTAPATPSPVIDIPCKQTARYVIIQTTYKAPEDTDSTGPVLEICEIEVIGCNIGHYGPSCSSCGGCENCNIESGCRVTCSQNCIDRECDEYGNCSRGCKHGYWGNKCLNGCPSTCFMTVCNMSSGICNSCNAGYYGSLCHMSCSRYCAQPSCSQNGTCIGRCKPNWIGNRCDECDYNHYGHSCSNTCSVNCLGQICNNITGFCTYGCITGFYSVKCEQRCSASCPSACDINSGECECPVGKYGYQCDKTCNKYCKSFCSRTSGICDSGCIAGRYGADCLRVCSNGCSSDCHQVDGSCVCKKGWQGQQCNECSQNRYGPQCDQECSPVCLNGTCFSNNGSCKEETKQSFKNNSTSNVSSTALYLVTAVLFLSIVLNIFFIVRNFRQTVYKKRISKDVQKQQDPTQDLNTPTYDRVEDNAGYQELGQLNQPSHYDKLK